jgi:hypothetical protein
MAAEILPGIILICYFAEDPHEHEFKSKEVDLPEL